MIVKSGATFQSFYGPSHCLSTRHGGPERLWQHSTFGGRDKGGTGVQAAPVCKGSYSDQLQETGGKRQLMVNRGDSEVKGLLLRAEDEVYQERRALLES